MNIEVKKAIIENEKRLLEHFNSSEYHNSIKFYISKLELFNRDMDLYDFINVSFKNKDDVEKIYNSKGFKSSRQLINEYKDKLDLSDKTTVNNIKFGNKYSYIEICAISNNYNPQVGMYYLPENDCVVIKTTVEDNNRIYDDRWLNQNKNVLIYCIQTEKKENVETLSFSHKPNAVIFNALMTGELIDIHVFRNSKKGDPYIYEGVFHPCGLVDGNNAFVLFREGHDEEIPYDNFYGQLWNKLVKTGTIDKIPVSLTEEFDLMCIEPSKRSKIRKSKRTLLQQKKLDLEINLRGDCLVVQHEKQKLISIGRNDLAEKVTDVSLTNSELGYDVLTFCVDVNGQCKNKHIIVKTSVNKDTLSYVVNEKEINELKDNNTDYLVYRVYDIFTDEPKYIDVTNIKSNYIAREYLVNIND